jgi:hypothetical protein
MWPKFRDAVSPNRHDGDDDDDHHHHSQVENQCWSKTALFRTFLNTNRKIPRGEFFLDHSLCFFFCESKCSFLYAVSLFGYQQPRKIDPYKLN